jgi:hypothetical protein
MNLYNKVGFLRTINQKNSRQTSKQRGATPPRPGQQQDDEDQEERPEYAKKSLKDLSGC